MEVNFDGLRKNIARDYSGLVGALNRHLAEDKETFVDRFTADDIQDYLDDLRSAIATLICLEGDCTDVSSLDIRLKTFNPQDEEAADHEEGGKA